MLHRKHVQNQKHRGKLWSFPILLSWIITSFHVHSCSCASLDMTMFIFWLHSTHSRLKIVCSFLFLFTLKSFFLFLFIIPFYRTLGKIQGDSRKFLNRFKSYFGSQISSHSQSLNEVHIYQLAKIPTKRSFFSFFFFI